MLPAMNDAPPTVYLGDNRCKNCGGRERYRSSRACVACAVRRAREQTALKRAAAARAPKSAEPTPNTDPMDGLI
jgi:hypothetical protein